MGHKYVKEEETFNTLRNGTVPKPSDQEVAAGKYLKSNGTWGTPSGGGGGSDVSITPTLLDGIKIANFEIDGDTGELYAPSLEDAGFTYDILYEKTTFVSADGTADVTRNYTLNASIDNYDALLIFGVGLNIQATEDARSQYQSLFIMKDDYYQNATISAWTGQSHCLDFSTQTNLRILFLRFTSSTTLTTIAGRTETWNEPTIWKIYGLKFMPRTPKHQYSITEQVVGFWINNKPIYEKVVTTGGSIPSDATLFQRISLTGYDIIQYTKNSE